MGILVVNVNVQYWSLLFYFHEQQFIQYNYNFQQNIIMRYDWFLSGIPLQIESEAKKNKINSKKSIIWSLWTQFGSHFEPV